MKSTTQDHRAVILGPVSTEKTHIGMAAETYTFRVAKAAHKIQIRQAVEALFNVEVLAVRVVNVQSKPKRRGIYRGVRPGYKKAIVKLATGNSIPIFEGME